MTNTPNYNLLLAEGTDLVNYLTQTNPNFTTLDTVIKGVSDLTVTPATEVTTGTAHAISKTLPDATVIKFTATSNWQTGDTMTLDGNPVTPLKTDGTTLKTGDYIIGSAVLMIQDGTRLTVLVASSPDAGDINYDNTVSGLASNKVQGAIDEINSNLSSLNWNDVHGASILGVGDTKVLNVQNNLTKYLYVVFNFSSQEGHARGACIIPKLTLTSWYPVVVGQETMQVRISYNAVTHVIEFVAINKTIAEKVYIVNIYE